MVDEIAYLNNWIIQWEWVDGEVVVYNENFLDYDKKGRGYFNYGVGGANFSIAEKLLMAINMLRLLHLMKVGPGKKHMFLYMRL